MLDVSTPFLGNCISSAVCSHRREDSEETKTVQIQRVFCTQNGKIQKNTKAKQLKGLLDFVLVGEDVNFLWTIRTNDKRSYKGRIFLINRYCYCFFNRREEAGPLLCIQTQCKANGYLYIIFCTMSDSLRARAAALHLASQALFNNANPPNDSGTSSQTPTSSPTNTTTATATVTTTTTTTRTPSPNQPRGRVPPLSFGDGFFLAVDRESLLRDLTTQLDSVDTTFNNAG